MKEKVEKAGVPYESCFFGVLRTEIRFTRSECLPLLKNKISQINDANCENFSYYFQVDYLEGMT
ncbi:hypothetical protein HCG83_05170 [Enterococcus casseliflavus]|nr:hypothetical protein [Enterococcus casseliflavus]MBX9126577.1 hypothetical protein [Enterococcus casseliflavus]